MNPTPTDSKRLVATLRRQLTFKDKRIAQLTRDQAEVQRSQRVLRWAKRGVTCGFSRWNLLQLQRAVKAAKL